MKAQHKSCPLCYRLQSNNVFYNNLKYDIWSIIFYNVEMFWQFHFLSGCLIYSERRMGVTLLGALRRYGCRFDCNHKLSLFYGFCWRLALKHHESNYENLHNIFLDDVFHLCNFRNNR